MLYFRGLCLSHSGKASGRRRRRRIFSLVQFGYLDKGLPGMGGMEILSLEKRIGF